VSEVAAKVIAGKAAAHKWPIDACQPLDLSRAFPGVFTLLDQPGIQRNMSTLYLATSTTTTSAGGRQLEKQRVPVKRRSDESENRNESNESGSGKRRSERTRHAMDYSEE
jgi:hypothetical protein